MKRTAKSGIIGVDVGGTKIRAGVLTPGGDLLCEPVVIATGGSDDRETICGRIIGSIDSAIRKSGLKTFEISGIGMGVTGPLDSKNGIILECPQLPTMNFFPLMERVIDKFKIPVVMDNDANALLLGESTWGAGKGYRISLGFTLGTGLGCALVVDNKLFTGVNGLAGEIWPSPLDDETIEDTVSGRGVSSIYFRLSNQMKSAEEISGLAFNGDIKAIESWGIFGRALAVALAWGINFTDPDIVILGGSIAKSYELFSDSMESHLKKYICPVPAEKTRIEKASLGDNAGFMGAAALVSVKREIVKSNKKEL